MTARMATVLRLLDGGEVWTSRQVGTKLDLSKAVAQLELRRLKDMGLVEHAKSEPGSHYPIAGFRRVRS